jgi:hypothetical protein
MPPLVEDTEQTHWSLVTLGTAQRDVEVILRMNAEQFRLLYPKVRYYKLDRVQTKVDDLYKESIGFPTYAVPIEIPALIMPGPQMNLLKKYGIEEEQEAICVMNARLNDQAGIYPHTGDLMEWAEVRWETLTAVFGDYMTNTQVPLNLILTLKQAARR